VLILAIDTCDAYGSVALVERGILLAAEQHEAGEDYSTWLLPAVDRVFSAAGRCLEDVAVYAATAGPGSFTGIRVALTTVKAWNEVFHKPIAAVSRLEAFAVQARGSTERGAPEFVAAYCDAQRGQLYGAVYRRHGVLHEPLGEARVAGADELIRWAGGSAGDGSIAWVSPEPASLAGVPAWLDRVGKGEILEQVPRLVAPAVAKIAAQLAEQSQLTDALGLDANYIRRPDAEVKWKGYSKPVV
jgi:tRNA threonylcarbamoyladenosine biosynthesis protein TsaB